MPRPGSCNDVVKVRIPRLPAQHPSCLLAGCYQHGGVSPSACCNHVRDRTAGYALCRGNDLTDAETASISKIEYMCTFVPVHVLQSQGMRLGQVIHMHIIPNAGPIGRWIVVAEDLQLGPFTRNGSKNVRNQMSFR